MPCGPNDAKKKIKLKSAGSFHLGHAMKVLITSSGRALRTKMKSGNGIRNVKSIPAHCNATWSMKVTGWKRPNASTTEDRRCIFQGYSRGHRRLQKCWLVISSSFEWSLKSPVPIGSWYFTNTFQSPPIMITFVASSSYWPAMLLSCWQPPNFLPELLSWTRERSCDWFAVAVAVSVDVWWYTIIELSNGALMC